MTKTNELFAEALRDTRSSVECARLRLRILKANRRKLNRIGSLLIAAIADDTESTVQYTSPSSVYCVADNLDSFKDFRLEMILNAMENIATDAGRTRDWPNSLNRDYHYMVDNIAVTVAAYVKSDSPTCRKVLVGTEMVTQEKWEIRCD